MIHVEERHLNIIKAILEPYTAGMTIKAFGSRVKGTHHAHSDLDLAFIRSNAQPLSIQQWGELKEAFSLSDLPWFVDVVCYADSSDYFREVIDRDGVELT